MTALKCAALAKASSSHLPVWFLEAIDGAAFIWHMSSLAEFPLLAVQTFTAALLTHSNVGGVTFHFCSLAVPC